MKKTVILILVSMISCSSLLGTDNPECSTSETLGQTQGRPLTPRESSISHLTPEQAIAQFEITEEFRQRSQNTPQDEEGQGNQLNIPHQQIAPQPVGTDVIQQQGNAEKKKSSTVSSESISSTTARKLSSREGSDVAEEANIQSNKRQCCIKRLIHFLKRKFHRSV